MANLMDYMAWRGEFPLSVSPWNEVDALLAAVLSYLNFHGMGDYRGWTLREAKRIDLLVPDDHTAFPARRKMFEAMAESERFGDVRMHHFIALTDAEVSMQFSAMCLDLPDNTMAVVFRGTDNTLVGWREDFNMAYQTQVPGQQAAAYYLAKAAKVTDRPIRLIGHSKGGNLAVYAAASVSRKIQGRIEGIWSFDGPGMNLETARGEGYERIRDRIRSYIPQTSIIGLLMEYYKPYTVVRSGARGLEQHDPMTWQVYGGHFEELESIDRTASLVSETLHEWLANSTPEQRGAFVDTLFRLADNTNATKMSDLLGEKFKNLRKIIGGRKEVDPETRKLFSRLMMQAVSMGVGNVVERVRGKSDQDGDDEWTTISQDEWDRVSAELTAEAERRSAEEAEAKAAKEAAKEAAKAAKAQTKKAAKKAETAESLPPEDGETE